METYPGNLDGLAAYRFNGGAPSYTSGGIRRGSGSKSSVATPGWKTMTKYQRKYVAAWHAFSNTYESWTMLDGYASGSNGPLAERYGYFHTNIVALNGFGPSWGNWSWPSTDADKKALSKIQKQITTMAMNLAQTIAERKQTVSLIGKSVRRLVQLALWIRKGDFKSIHARYGLPKPVRTRSGGYVVPRYYREVTRRTVYDDNGQPVIQRRPGKPDRPKVYRDVTYRDRNRPKSNFSFGDIWLEYQYGWRPLLNDIYGAAEVLAGNHAAAKPLRFTATASATIQKLGASAPCYFSVNGSNYASRVDYSVAEKCRYVLEVVEDQAWLNHLASTGLTNPLLLAWELVPYSFVVDWFIPIGKYLEQLEYARGLTFRRGTVSSNKTGGAEVKYYLSSVTPGYYPGTTNGKGFSIVKKSKTRTLLGSFPYQKFPSLRPNLGVSQVLSGLALLTQLLKGRTTVR